MPRASVLVALSGGPDSVCLTLLLKAYRKSRFEKLAVAHVHHGLRRGADADERWVRQFCVRHGLDCHLIRVRVKRSGTGNRESLEEAARRERYRVLLDLARKKKFDHLVTAHTADDQAETVLMRMALGSGLWGLAAIPGIRAERGVRIVRPLLGVSKRALTDALLRAGVRYRRDASNRSPRFLRNRIRARVLPLMSKELNPRVPEHLADLAHDAMQWRTWAEQSAEKFLARAARITKRGLEVDAESLRELPTILRTPVFFKICERLTRAGQHLRREHVRQIESLLGINRPFEQRLSLGLLLRMSRERGRVRIIWRIADARSGTR